MTGDELKAWRDERGATQAQVGEKVGKTWRTVARWEAAGEADIPEPAARLLAGAEFAPAQAAPKVEKAAVIPAAKLAGAPPQAIAQAAGAQLAQVAKLPFGVLKGARRPTAQEVEKWPHRYAGPDVWVRVYEPAWVQPNGAKVSRLIQKGAANGQGGYSVHLVGSCSRGGKAGYEPGDLPALPPGVYRPFTPGGGVDVRSSAPKGKARA